MSFLTADVVATRTTTPRVNLLPPEIGEARRFKALQVGLAGAMLGVVAVCGAAYAITAGHVAEASDSLVAEEARTPALQAAQSRYAEVPAVLAQVTTAEQMQQAATAYDIAWYSYLDQVAVKAPQDITLTQLTFTVVPPAEQVADAAASTDPSAVSGVGTVQIIGEAPSQSAVATWLEQLGTVPGFAAPALTGTTLAQDTGIVTFTTTATVTDDALLAQQ